MSNTKNSLGNESDTVRDAALAAFDFGVENPDAPVPIRTEQVDDAGAQELDDEGNPIEAGEETPEEKEERERAEQAAADIEAGKSKETGKPAKAPKGKAAKPDAVPAVSKDKVPGEEEVAETPEQIAAKAKLETDTEIAELGLKGKTAERFRELVDYKRNTAPVIESLGGMEYLTEIGISSKQDLENLVFDGQSARDWDRQLSEVGALPEQVGQAFGAIAGFNRGLAAFQANGDTSILEQYIANLQKEVDNAAQIIGRQAGGYDPLKDAANKDLKERVESGDLSIKDAQELIRLRVIERERTAAGERQQQTTQRTQAEQTEINEAVKGIGKVGAEMKALDGEKLFAYRMQRMGPKLEEIKQKFPPALWPAKAEAAYLRIPAPVEAPAPAQKPRVGHRTTALRVDAAVGSQVERQPIDPLDAFDLGVAEMREQGR